MMSSTLSVLGSGLLEHELVTNSHATNIVNTVSLDGLCELVPLAHVGCAIISRDGVVPDKDCHIDFGLFDCL